MKNFIQPGENITLPAPAAVTSGQLVAVGSIIGVAQHDAVAGAPLVLVRRGVFSLPKTADQAWTVGAKAYRVAADGTVSTTASGNTLIGAVAEAAAGTDAAGLVLLDGSIR